LSGAAVRSEQEFSAMLRTCGRSVALLVLVTAIIGCDQSTKRFATETLAGTTAQSFLADTVRLTYAENIGGFLSLGAGMAPMFRTAVFTVATGAILLALMLVAWRQRNQPWRATAFALFIAGGVSNWLDRLNDGRVVDFMNVGIGALRTGVFNGADVAIMLGAAMYVIGQVRVRSARP
jgi:signal peptidase II